jgi:hypothetical protein
MSDQRNIATVVSQGQYDALRQYAEANNLKVSGVLRRIVAEFTGVPDDIEGMTFHRRPRRPKLSPEERRAIRADTCRRISEIKESCPRCNRTITKGRLKRHLAACGRPKPPRLTAEELRAVRAERMRKLTASLTAEQLSEKARRGAASMTPEQRAARALKVSKTTRERMTPEQRRERAHKGGDAVRAEAARRRSEQTT